MIERWKINDYPFFLESYAMKKDAWKALKNRISNRILESLHSNSTKKFIFTFMGGGASVGYDVYHERVFSVDLKKIFESVGKSLQIDIEIRNVAIGDNPCMPYGLCVRTFAGQDSDLILWEHTYDCYAAACRCILEQFIRQALNIPFRPILAVASSSIPNWSILFILFNQRVIL
jgi:hypothetical protein